MADVQIVLCGLVARVLQVVYLCARSLGDQPGKVAQTVSLGHLVVDVDPVALSGGFSRASCMQRTVSWMWMKAQVGRPCRGR